MRNATLIHAVLAVLLLGAAPAFSASSAAAEAVTAAPSLKEMLNGDGALVLAGRSLDRATLLPLYEARGFEPIWVAQPDRVAALVKALGGAAAHGLDPAEFAVPDGRAEEHDLLLTDAFLRYGSALARGRVNS